MFKTQSFCLLALILTLCVAGCGTNDGAPGAVADEAMAAGRQAASLPAADEDYFKDMDGAGALTASEVKGRNNWIVWTAGNDRFWDHLVGKSFGVVDLLKVLSSHPNVKHLSRDTRWQYLGLVNEPCFRQTEERRQRSLRLVVGHAQPEPPARSFRERKEISRRPNRRARQKHAGGILLRLRLGVSSACGFFRIRILTKQRRKNGMLRDFTPTRNITTIKISFARIASACLAVSAMSDRARRNRPPIRENPKWENLNSNPGAQ